MNTAALDIQGYRGAHGLAPENTLTGFARTLVMDRSTFEIDVAMIVGGSLERMTAVTAIARSEAETPAFSPNSNSGPFHATVPDGQQGSKGRYRASGSRMAM